MYSKVILHGILAEKYGKEFDFNVDSIKQTFKALNSNFKDFGDFIRDYEFTIIADGIEINLNDVTASSYKFKTLDIIPATEGEGGKGGVVKDVIGGIEIVAGAILVATDVGGSIGVGLIITGASTLANGILTGLMKPPSYDKSPDADTSNIFDGPRNTSKEGMAVPIIYGEMMTGSIVVSGYVAEKGQNI